MQTFLPYPSYVKSAQCLDNKRLGKQRVEAWQIYLAITKPNYGWKNHPIVRMWRGYELSLLFYGFVISETWYLRGFKDIMAQRFCDEMIRIGKSYMYTPYWLGNKKFHASHRSNLLRKNKKWYSKFSWKEPDNLPYVWIGD